MVGDAGRGDYRGAEATRFVAAAPGARRRGSPLCNGSGGPRGFAHIGAIEVLERKHQADRRRPPASARWWERFTESGKALRPIEKLALELNMLDWCRHHTC